ncbi:MAG TPA: C39 family peptidase, partial [Aggregatilineales bacterium]|nr:C39 family peptidase [Aggregatilineales bacterium]
VSTATPSATATPRATIPPTQTTSSATATPVIPPSATKILPTVVPSTVPTIAPTATAAVVLPVAFHNDGFTWEPQKWNNCGPANLTQALHYYGWGGTQDQAAAWLKPNYLAKNVSPWQMRTFVNDKTDLKAVTRVAGDLTLIKRIVYAKLAVILETGFVVAGEGWMGHYLTVVGWDDSAGILYGFDTYLGIGSDKLGMREKYGDLDSRWQQFNRTYIIIYPKSREADVAAILGPDGDLTYNAQHALSAARTEAANRQDNQYAWFNIGSSYVLLGDYSKAALAYDKARSVGGGLPWRFLWYQFGSYEAYYNTGNYAQVLADVTTNVNNTTEVVETYYWKAMVEAAQGKKADAVTDFKAVLTFNPNFQPAADQLTKVQNGTFAGPVVAQAGK